MSHVAARRRSCSADSSSNSIHNSCPRSWRAYSRRPFAFRSNMRFALVLDVRGRASPLRTLQKPPSCPNASAQALVVSTPRMLVFTHRMLVHAHRTLAHAHRMLVPTHWRPGPRNRHRCLRTDAMSPCKFKKDSFKKRFEKFKKDSKNSMKCAGCPRSFCERTMPLSAVLHGW